MSTNKTTGSQGLPYSSPFDAISSPLPHSIYVRHIRQRCSGHAVSQRTYPTQDKALSYARRLARRLIREAGSPAF
jgi:hypothetical protein